MSNGGDVRERRGGGKRDKEVEEGSEFGGKENKKL